VQRSSLELKQLSDHAAELSGISDARLNRQAQMWRVMQSSHEALSSGRKITQREIYYLHAGAGIFRSQLDSNSALQLLSNLLHVPRINLGFLTSARGMFCGCLGLACRAQSADSGATLGQALTQASLDVPFMGARPMAVPSDFVSNYMQLLVSHLPPVQQPRFLLVVEKDCIFQRLAEDGFFKAHPCVIITAKGMPDIATRAFVWRLHTELRLPVFGLSDWNPYGLGIMLSYKSGSETRGAEGNAFNVPLRWLGLHYDDIERFQVPDAAWQPLTQRDISRARGLLQHPTVQEISAYAADVHCMLRADGKLELEALLTNGLQYMSETYLPQRLRDGDAQ
jgi:meiotic recombination protein SPO11